MAQVDAQEMTIIHPIRMFTASLPCSLAGQEELRDTSGKVTKERVSRSLGGHQASSLLYWALRRMRKREGGGERERE
jgi:hypothetical protein